MIINHVFKCTQEQFENYKSRDLVSLVCIQCNTTYSRSKKAILDTFTKHNTYPKYCSNQCIADYKKEQQSIKVNCLNCNKNVLKLLNQYKKYKHNFCSRSCSTIYNNKNKTHGTRRSKLEVYIEEQLTELYPELEILYSNKQIIGSELDIFIPSLNLAFEIQGIFHYEPIFGQEKLEQIQKNDLEKIQKCNELNIKLIHIDTRSQKRFSKKTSNKFFLQIEKELS